LIILIVLGHFLDITYEYPNRLFLKKSHILFMPLFVFLLGYLTPSKKERISS
jgi:hypothetical protein